MLFFKMNTRNYSPWISEFVNKEDYCIIEHSCSICGLKYMAQRSESYYDRPMKALLYTGNRWTDIIGSGERSFFTIISQRVLEIWESEGIGKFPSFPVTVIPPYKKMTEPPPMYHRLDYKKMEGAELDLEVSGFISPKYCEVCQTHSYDWIQSDRMKNFKITPYVIKEGTWNGDNVFRPSYPEGFMFCTEKVVDCAAKYKMTNFCFTPLEIAHSAVSFRGIDYTVKNWRKKMEKQVEEYRKEFRPIDPVTLEFIK